MKFNIQGKDIFSCLVVICATVLLALHIDTVIGFTLLAIVAAYYGIDLTPYLRIGRNQKPRRQ